MAPATIFCLRSALIGTRGAQLPSDVKAVAQITENPYLTRRLFVAKFQLAFSFVFLLLLYFYTD
jgi:hypothetical protein